MLPSSFCSWFLFATLITQSRTRPCSFWPPSPWHSSSYKPPQVLRVQLLHPPQKASSQSSHNASLIHPSALIAPLHAVWGQKRAFVFQSCHRHVINDHMIRSEVWWRESENKWYTPLAGMKEEASADNWRLKNDLEFQGCYEGHPSPQTVIQIASSIFN